MLLRVILGILSVLGVFLLPWWLVFLIALALLFRFKFYFEIIIIAVLADILYGSLTIFSFPYPLTVFSIIILYLVVTFKKNLILYQ